MKKYFIALFPILLVACQFSTNKYTIEHYYNSTQKDIILTNIITYITPKAPNSTNQTRFQPQFKKYYEKQLSSFKIENYFIDKDSIHYFFVIRPVGGLPYKRGVIGRYKIDENLKPYEFEEVVNTPHLEEKIVIERGSFLLKELIKNKNLDKYLAMKHYVEWPDATLVYDKKANEWVTPQSTH